MIHVYAYTRYIVYLYYDTHMCTHTYIHIYIYRHKHIDMKKMKGRGMKKMKGGRKDGGTVRLRFWDASTGVAFPLPLRKRRALALKDGGTVRLHF